MEREFSIDLLNSRHDFPCEFMLKVIGKDQDDFVQRVLDAVGGEPAYKTRATPNGKHIAITMEPIVESAEQVLELYARIQTVEGVVMSM